MDSAAHSRWHADVPRATKLKTGLIGVVFQLSNTHTVPCPAVVDERAVSAAKQDATPSGNPKVGAC
ncbi:hypothetical protein [Dyella nitratireducens]|nr:hypothetical protein [Dyella nitratireducens]